MAFGALLSPFHTDKGQPPLFQPQGGKGCGQSLPYDDCGAHIVHILHRLSLPFQKQHIPSDDGYAPKEQAMQFFAAGDSSADTMPAQMP